MKILYLIVLFTLFISAVNAQDINETQYDINDPRNPNCPCHAYQKVADEEYKQLLNKENNKQVEEKSDSNLSENKSIEPSKSNEYKEDTILIHKRRHKHIALAKRTKPKKRKIKVGRKDTSKCFHW